ncbi:MAG TPA: RNA polymerase sigma factor [Candidatus Acidoferrales bacterium]|nr:RNA polymerase sigma factor [Candidatus Acidoferrales bacterium]
MDALVEDFTARRPSGFERAYALWSATFLGVARHVLGDDTAEDCVHDALMRVWRAPNRFRGDRSMLRAYLAACVRNEAMTALRSRERRDAREAKAARLDVAIDAAEPVADPIEARRVRSALARLPADQRETLELAYYGNRTQSEIAERLGIPLGTVKSRISAAMRKLHAELMPTPEVAP